jgi:hypothetical protein
VTIMLIFGRWGGAGIRWRSRPSIEAFRMCLGWVALAIFRADMDVWVESVRDTLRCLREATPSDWPRGIHSDLARG